MNIHDAGRIREMMTAFGFIETLSLSDADILIFYTCSIREKAVQKLYSDIGRSIFEKTKIVAIGGCIAQEEGNSMFSHNSSINIVFGPQTYHRLPFHVNSILSNKKRRIIDIEFSQQEKFKFLEKRAGHVASEFVTIQEGCDNFCSYCIVPYTRGREYSRPAADIVSEARDLVASGVIEITLIGQNVNSYHGEAAYINIGESSSKEWRIERLLYEVANIQGLKRLRYTTSHPKDFSEELMKAHEDLKSVLVPFVHIPAQSGSDRILKLMNRGHTSNEYLSKLERFRDICQNISFSSDFIVGFPTETEEDFEDTLTLAKKANYSLSYSFKYSVRKNTPAEKMKDQISEKVKADRLMRLQNVLFQSQIEFNKKTVGTTQSVLFERLGKKENQYLGKTVYFQSVLIDSDTDIRGKFMDVKIISGNQNSLFGKLT